MSCDLAPGNSVALPFSLLLSILSPVGVPARIDIDLVRDALHESPKFSEDFLLAVTYFGKTPTGWVFFGKQGFLPLPRTGVLTRMAKMTNVHSVHKNKAFAPPAPEKD